MCGTGHKAGSMSGWLFFNGHQRRGGQKRETGSQSCRHAREQLCPAVRGHSPWGPGAAAHLMCQGPLSSARDTPGAVHISGSPECCVTFISLKKKTSKKVQVFGAANADDIYTHFLKRFFGCGPFSKSLLSLLRYWFCFVFWCFACEARGTTAPRPGNEPTPLHREAKS